MIEPNSILIVDDTPESLALLTGILTAEGFLVRPADSGELALASVAARPPDLILLGIRMPEVDGYEVCRRLKADKKTRAIPIIFISASNDERDKVLGFQAGSVDYITKPFYTEEVLARVKTHLALRRAQWDLEAKNTKLEAEMKERKRAENALRESEQRLSLIFNTVEDVLFLLAVEPEDCFRFIAIRENKTVRWEEVSAHPTGTLYGLVAVTPAWSADGNCTHLIGSVHDITEIRRAGQTPRSLTAFANLKKIDEEHMADVSYSSD